MDSRKIGAIIAVFTLVAVGAAAAYVVLDKEDEKDLRVVYLNKSSYETQVIAKEKGFFDKAGVSIEHITVTGSGADAVNAMLTGSADIAACGDGPAASALNKEGDRIVVLCNVNKSTGNQIWVSGPDLANKFVLYDKENPNKEAVRDSWAAAAASKAGGEKFIKLGVQKGATSESELKAWLDFMGIEYSDFGKAREGQPVQLIDAKANTLVSLLDAKSIDVMGASLPYPANATDMVTGAKAVGNNSDNGSFGISCYITTKEVYESKTEAVKKFVEGVKLASDYMADPANENECATICANVFGTEAKNVRNVFETADFRVDWDDGSAEVLYNTVKNKGFQDKVTLQMCKDACPADLKAHIASLYA